MQKHKNKHISCLQIPERVSCTHEGYLEGKTFAQYKQELCNWNMNAPRDSEVTTIELRTTLQGLWWLANFYCKAPESKYFGLCRPYDPCVTSDNAARKQPLGTHKQMGVTMVQESFIYRNRCQAKGLQFANHSSIKKKERL